MSQRLISLNEPLKRLREEGYEISIHGQKFLLVHHVPYVTPDTRVAYGVLVSPLKLAGDVLAPPENHIIHFIGEQPCHKDGSTIQQIVHAGPTDHTPGLRTDRSFSNKPAPGFTDLEKVIHYINILSGPAQALEQGANSRTYIALPDVEDKSVFIYADTASTRSNTAMLADKLSGQRIAIVGLGGTGSYVLDFIAKTPVAEIHLFDADLFLSHNAFRAPGAAPLDTLRAMPTKVGYLHDVYAAQRAGIITHPHNINETNVQSLTGMNFVFICIDKASAKPAIMKHLDKSGISFIDCGMGLTIADKGITGQVRTITSTPAARVASNQIPTAPELDGDNPYATNIQIAELNALNAAQAVIKWKLNGFYLDQENEHMAVYDLDGNHIHNHHGAA